MKGVLAGLFGCVFGIIGIFAFAIVFVPLAGICAIVGLIRGIVGKSAAGIGTSLLAGALAVIGYVLSPALWVVTAGLVLAYRAPPASPTSALENATSMSLAPQPTLPVMPTVPDNPSSTDRQSAFATAPGSAQALARAGAAARAAIAECKNKRVAGQLKNYLASAACSNPQIVHAYQQVGYRYMDLIYALTKKRVEVAMALDQGKISEAQGSEIITQYTSFLAGIEHQRDQEAK